MPQRAEDLPDGSVVAGATQAYIKVHPTDTAEWRATGGAYATNWYIQSMLDFGAGQILRVGDGLVRQS